MKRRRRLTAGLYCDTTCEAFLQDGADCDFSSQCAHDWCNQGTCDDPGFCSMMDRK